MGIAKLRLSSSTCFQPIAAISPRLMAVSIAQLNKGTWLTTRYSSGLSLRSLGFPPFGFLTRSTGFPSLGSYMPRSFRQTLKTRCRRDSSSRTAFGDSCPNRFSRYSDSTDGVMSESSYPLSARSGVCTYSAAETSL